MLIISKLSQAEAQKLKPKKLSQLVVNKHKTLDSCTGSQDTGGVLQQVI